MKRKSQSTIRAKGPAVIAVGVLLAAWSLACLLEVVPRYMLPAPWEVVEAFITELPILLDHSVITLQEAFYGLVLGVGLGFLFAAAMDAWEFLCRALYPILVLTQT
ncbi:MAG: ABC transporter permease, partial [Oscillibacter sp.]|nr:ABC transporter permease [Oscillibacter sp.]